MKKARLVTNFLLLVFLASQVTLAQVTTGTILGTVTDSTGAVVPGATVTLRNVETGISRTETADSAGRYRASQLSLGSYEVTVTAAGFQTAVRSGVTLTVGREATVDFSMQVGAVSEKITVTGEAPLIETTNSTVSSLVTEKAMRDLPLNGRSFADLTAIQPGVVSATGVSASVFTGGPRMSLNGARPQQSLYLLDGLDIVSPNNNVTPSSVMNQLLGVDTIREFSVLTNNPGAQYGRALGGIVNAVTRSGTNELHGGAFEFLRNNVLDARNFFDYSEATLGKRLPPFRRNQFGATFGGPIVKDSTFFFVAYEGLRERLGLSDLGFLPTQEAREQGILRDKAGNITQTVKVNPDIVPFLNLMPLPNGAAIGGGLAQFIGSRTQPGGEDYGVVRMDQKLGEKDSLFGRLTIDDSAKTVPSYAKIPGGAPTVDQGGYRFASIVETRIFSPTLLNTLSVGFARNNTAESVVGDFSGLDPRLSVVPGAPIFGPITVGGISLPGGFGAGACDPIHFVDTTFDFSDNVSYTRGRHSLNLGATIKRYQMNELNGCWTMGWIFFASVPAVLQGQPFLDTTTLGNPDTYRGWRQTYGSFHIQDDFNVLPNLTLNLGLRWERVTGPSEVNGKISTLKDVLRDATYSQPDKLFELRDAFKGFVPRFGFSWTPFHDQKTVLRGGFGVFREIPLEFEYAESLFAPPFAQRFDITGTPFPFPSPLRAVTPTSGESETVAFDFKYPYNYQWNFGVERQLSQTLVAKATYSGTRGLDLPAINNPDQPIPIRITNPSTGALSWFTPGTGTVPSAPRPNPNFANERYTSQVGNTYYHALQLSLEQRFRSGLLLNTSYTWSKNIDDVAIGVKCADGISSDVIVYNVYDIAADRGLSPLDTRHNFSLSYSYELPFGRGKAFGSNSAGVTRVLLGGWQFNGIFSARTGLPINALDSFANARTNPSLVEDRPDLLPGKSNNPTQGVTAGCAGITAGRTLGGPNLYFDPCSFTPALPGFFGNTGRDTVIQPGLFTWNASLFKEIPLGSERHRLEFRAEFFNLLNRANFSFPNSHIFTSAAGTINPAVGTIVATSTIPRNIQFGLKYTF